MCKCSQKEVKDEATRSRICGATLPRFTKSFFSVEHISSRSAAQTRLHHQHFVFHGQYCHISTFQLKCHLISGPLHLLPPPRLLCPRFNANASDLPGRSKEVHCVRTLAITGAFGNTCTCSDASRL